MKTPRHHSNKTHISAAQVREVLSYDSLTGKFHWLVDRGAYKCAGIEAGCVANGRITITAFGVSFPAGVLAWLWVHGVYPEYDIDHEDRNPLDNRLTNLREATRAQNIYNQGARKHSSTGLKGIVLRANKTYWARIRAGNGKRYSLGLYKDPEHAAAAYRIAAAALHGEFAGERQ